MLYEEAFPPFGPPPPTPAPAATAEVIAPDAVLCQWHISIYFVLAILEKANTHIKNYMTKTLVPSYSRKSAPSPPPAPSPSSRAECDCPHCGTAFSSVVVVAPVARRPRRFHFSHSFLLICPVLLPTVQHGVFKTP